MAEGNERMALLAAAAGGPQESIGGEDFAAGKRQRESAAVMALDQVQAGLEADRDSGIPRGVEEAIDDGLRGVGDGEHASVGLGFQIHAAQAEPLDGLAGAEARERADEGASAARVALGKLAGIEAGVGGIAASAARDADLGEHMAGFFENRDGGPGIGLGGGDGSEKPRRPAAGDHDVSRGTQKLWKLMAPAAGA